MQRGHLNAKSNLYNNNECNLSRLQFGGDPSQIRYGHTAGVRAFMILTFMRFGKKMLVMWLEMLAELPTVRSDGILYLHALFRLDSCKPINQVTGSNNDHRVFIHLRNSVNSKSLLP